MPRGLLPLFLLLCGSLLPTARADEATVMVVCD